MAYDFRSELEKRVGKLTDDEYCGIKKMAIDDLVKNDQYRLIEVETALTPDATMPNLDNIREALYASCEVALKIHRRLK